MLLLSRLYSWVRSKTDCSTMSVYMKMVNLVDLTPVQVTKYLQKYTGFDEYAGKIRLL